MILFEIIVVNIAAIIGFMFLNFPKGKIFLGDGGAYFIGFMLATLSILTVARHDEVSILLPLAILIYPVFEVLFSIYRRKIIRKKSTTLADKTHLHQLIFKRITKNNPLTSLYIWKRYIIFIIISTIGYTYSSIQIAVIIAFIVWYLYQYRKIVRFNG